MNKRNPSAIRYALRDLAWEVGDPARLGSCYLAGPMTGLPDFNVHAFRTCASVLRQAGWTVYSPSERDEEAGINLEGYPTGDLAELRANSEFDFRKSFSWDIEQVCSRDAVIAMPGWEESTGASIEVETALLVGTPVYTYLSQRRIEKPGSAGSCSAPTERAGTGEGDVRASSSPTNRHPNSARFHELVDEIGKLHDKKQQDYGSDTDPFANVRASQEWGVPAWVGALVRLNDKVTRLKSFARKGSLANESAEDSMRDIAVYALIALVLYEQDSAK